MVVVMKNLLTSTFIVLADQQPHETTAIQLDSSVVQIVQCISDLEERVKASIIVDIQRMQDEIVTTLNRTSYMNTSSTDEN